MRFQWLNKTEDRITHEDCGVCSKFLRGKKQKDNKQAFDEAVKLEKEYKQKILDELLRLEKDGFKIKEWLIEK